MEGRGGGGERGGVGGVVSVHQGQGCMGTVNAVKARRPQGLHWNTEYNQWTETSVYLYF